MLAKDVLTKEYLRINYVELNKSSNQISRETGYTRSTITILLNKYNLPVRKCGRRSPNLIGKIYNGVKILSKAKVIDKRHPKLNCRCGCGNKFKTTSHNILNNPNISCVDCGNKRTAKSHWTGEGNISGKFWSSIRCGARVRNLEFSITIEEAWNLFIEQDAKCALSGSNIIITSNNKNTASLDRIDSSKGYTKDNIQWVHKRLNWMKGNINEDEFINWCEKVYKFKRLSI
jgi:hypothetical protein